MAPCDQFVYEPLHQTKALFDKNSAYLEECRKAGVTIAGTCSPYLTGWIPVKGEHFVTTESSMTILGNDAYGLLLPIHSALAFCSSEYVQL